MSAEFIDGVWRPGPGDLESDPVDALWGMERYSIVEQIPDATYAKTSEHTATTSVEPGGPTAAGPAE